MKVLRHEHVEKADLQAGQFNNCEHLFIELAPGQCQTVSCQLPNGKHVTFGFVPGEGNEFECVDLHATVGRHWTDDTTFGRHHYQQHLIGFAKQGDTFDTRKGKKPTSLATLLLSSKHYQ